MRGHLNVSAAAIATALAAAIPLLSPDDAHARSSLPTEIVVTATRIATPIEEVGSAISVLEAREIDRRQFLRIEDALQLIPGVTADITGPPGVPAPIRLRGLAPRNTLVLIDGMEVADVSNANVQFQFGNIPAETVDRIEVLRGPQSALYGADASGGVINILTRTPDNPIEAQARIEYGSFETLKTFGELAGRFGPEGQGYAIGSFSFTDIEGFSTFNEDRGGIEEDGYLSRAWLAKGGWAFNESASLEVRGRYVDERQATDTNSFDLIDNFIDKEEAYIGASFDLTSLGGALDSTVAGSIVEHRREFINGFLDGDRYRGRKSKVDYRGALSLNEEHTSVFGAEWEKERLDQVAPQAGGVAFGPPAEAAEIDIAIRTLAFYAQHQWVWNGALSVIGGLRVDDNEVFGTDVTYRGTIAYNITQTGTRLRASGGSSVVTPSVFELNDICIGNADLDPERSVGFDIGVDQRFETAAIQVSATYFRSRIRDQIVYDGSPETGTALSDACAGFWGPFGGYQNQARVRTQGLEVAISAQPLDSVRFGMAYTLTDADLLTNNTPLRDVPRHEASVELSWTGWQDRLTLGADGRYRSSEPNFGGASDSFFVARLRGEVALWPDRLTLFSRVENLFNADYEESFGNGTPGRSGYVGLRARY